MFFFHTPLSFSHASLISYLWLGQGAKAGCSHFPAWLEKGNIRNLMKSMCPGDFQISFADAAVVEIISKTSGCLLEWNYLVALQYQLKHNWDKVVGVD